MQGKQLVLIIGGNLDDRRALIDQCRILLAGIFGPFVLESSIYESEAWGGKSSGNYLNQVLVFETDMAPGSILAHIKSVERQLGRTREVVWGDRTMDVDILFLDNEIVETNDLSIPHPFLQERRFVLVPLAEILPTLIHPTLGLSCSDLLQNCPDLSKVWKFKENV